MRHAKVRVVSQPFSKRVLGFVEFSSAHLGSTELDPIKRSSVRPRKLPGLLIASDGSLSLVTPLVNQSQIEMELGLARVQFQSFLQELLSDLETTQLPTGFPDTRVGCRRAMVHFERQEKKFEC